jgi:hypothetical protein
MAELEDTHDPRELITGDPQALHAAASDVQRVGTEVSGHGEQLRRVRVNSWEGISSDRFRAAADAVAQTSITDGDQAETVSTLIEDYAHTLSWAQTQAADAVALFHHADNPPPSLDPVTRDSPDPATHDTTHDADPAERHDERATARRREAQEIVSHARAVLAQAGDSTATAIVEILDTISIPAPRGEDAVARPAWPGQPARPPPPPAHRPPCRPPTPGLFTPSAVRARCSPLWRPHRPPTPRQRRSPDHPNHPHPQRRRCACPGRRTRGGSPPRSGRRCPVTIRAAPTAPSWSTHPMTTATTTP